MRGDQQIVHADRPASHFQLSVNAAIFGVSRDIQRQHRDRFKDALYLGEQLGRALFCTAIAQLDCHDDAGKNLLRSDLLNAMCGRPVRTVNHVADDIRVQQISAQEMSSGWAGTSSMSGRLSSGQSGASLLHSASSSTMFVGRVIGSMMSLLPSRWIITRSPGNSNSTGIRTAWLRLLRNSLTSFGLDGVDMEGMALFSNVYTKMYMLMLAVRQLAVSLSTKRPFAGPAGPNGRNPPQICVYMVCASLRLGRPPKRPFWRDASALTVLRLAPPFCPILLIHAFVPKTPLARVGT